MEFLLLFWEYFKIGLFTIGGGYAMIPMVKQMVLEHGWISNAEMLNFIAVSESTPGPFAINVATFVGMEVGKSTSLGLFGGFLGAGIATFAVVLPSLIIIVIVTKLFDKFRTNRFVEGALAGIRPVVVGLIFSAVISVGGSVILPSLDFTAISGDGFGKFNYVSAIMMVCIAPLGFIKIKGKKINPVILILLSALIGILLFGVFNLESEEEAVVGFLR
ncbi:MAG: chromate transporter [Corallococcus sp.]|nr:chromate transporter [Corallococcus sp.]